MALIMGPLVSSLPAEQYLAQRETWTFLLRNISLWRAQYSLPGVFESNPYPEVEGSIWTLIQEVLCYGLVFLAGISGLLSRRGYMSAALIIHGLLRLWLLLMVFPLGIHRNKLVQLHTLSLPFVLGMTFWLWRAHIPLSLVGIAALAGLAFVTKGTPVGFPALMLLLTYTTFWLGHVPQGWLRRYNRFGDYSCDMYAYALPLQGLVVWLFGPMVPAAHIALAFPLALIFALLSWRFVEAPALQLRQTRAARHLTKGSA